jgi:hypothetical protein
MLNRDPAYLIKQHHYQQEIIRQNHLKQHKLSEINSEPKMYTAEYVARNLMSIP